MDGKIFCKKCNEYRLLDKFYISKGKVKFPCKICQKKYQSEKYQKNKEQVLFKAKEYYKNNSGSIKAKTKIYTENNKKQIAEYQKKYIEKNKESLKKYRQKYYINNKLIIKTKTYIYILNNKEKLLEKNRKYYIDNKVKILEKSKLYYEINKEKILNRQYLYGKIKRKICINFRIKKTISRSISRYLHLGQNAKNGKSVAKYLPYSIDELKSHLEALFEPWMTLENWGSYNKEKWDDSDKSTWMWQIDHIIPHSDFKYTSMEDNEFKKCWSLVNLRPYSAKQNLLDGVNRTRHGATDGPM